MTRKDQLRNRQFAINPHNWNVSQIAPRKKITLSHVQRKNVSLNSIDENHCFEKCVAEKLLHSKFGNMEPVWPYKQVARVIFIGSEPRLMGLSWWLAENNFFPFLIFPLQLSRNLFAQKIRKRVVFFGTNDIYGFHADIYYWESLSWRCDERIFLVSKSNH